MRSIRFIAIAAALALLPAAAVACSEGPTQVRETVSPRFDGTAPAPCDSVSLEECRGGGTAGSGNRTCSC